jgi:hypothetical protein
VLLKSSTSWLSTLEERWQKTNPLKKWSSSTVNPNPKSYKLNTRSVLIPCSGSSRWSSINSELFKNHKLLISCLRTKIKSFSTSSNKNGAKQTRLASGSILMKMEKFSCTASSRRRDSLTQTVSRFAKISMWILHIIKVVVMEMIVLVSTALKMSSKSSQIEISQAWN